MCTVSFLPTKEGFILTSNRDEQSNRALAVFPSYGQSKSGKITFPKDGKAGGTWIAASSKKMICLLNGAFEKHLANPPYRYSRGKVVLDAFDFLDFETFRENYDLSQIEPHTLVMIEFEKDLILVEMRWDGEKKHIQKLDSKTPHIWSSVTLYSDSIIKKREEIFKEWCLENEFTVDNIKKLHLSSGLGDSRFDFLMKRENFLETISVTSAFAMEGEIELKYDDLLSKKVVNQMV